jgi:hypothetical protein
MRSSPAAAAPRRRGRREREEDLLEVGRVGAQLGHVDPGFGERPADLPAVGDGAGDGEAAVGERRRGEAIVLEQGDRALAVDRVDAGDEARRAVRRQQLVDRALGDQAPAADDRRAVAHELDLGQQVRADQHGRAARGELLDELADLDDAGRVEAVGRLVEHDEPRAAEQRQREAEALLHAEREGSASRVRPSGEADEREQLVDLAPGVAQPARRRLDLHVLARRRAGVDGRALDEGADLAHRGGEPGAARVLAEQRR